MLLCIDIRLTYNQKLCICETLFPVSKKIEKMIQVGMQVKKQR